MTSNEFIKKEGHKWQKIAAGEALAIASLETHRAMANRIFNNGGAEEGQIGHYNTTTPIYVNPKNSPKSFAPEGKNGTQKTVVQSISKTGKVRSKKVAIKADHTERKTKYFSSYAAFRQAIGRTVDKVNLNLSGRLQSAFVTGLKKVNNSTFVSALKRQEDINKKNGAEKHFGKKIFFLTAGERKLFISVMNKETQRILHAQ